MDDTDDRFVARRGSQGDDWNWETDAPPDESPAPRIERFAAVGGFGRWVASVWTSFRDWMGESYRRDAPPPRTMEAPALPEERPTPKVEVPAAPVEPSSEAPQAVADTKVPPAAELPPIEAKEKPRTLGSVIRWSRIVPRERRSRDVEPIAWSRVAGDRPKAAIALPRPAEIPTTDSSPLLMLLASIGLAAAIVIGVIVGVSAIDTGDGDNNGGVVGGVTHTPKTTLIPPETQTPNASIAPTFTPTPTATPQGSASATPRRSPTRTPSKTPSPKPTKTSRPTATPAPTAAPTPAPAPGPQGAVAAGLWANNAGAWWFGSVGAGEARFEEGQDVPILVQWNASAGQTYQVNLTYDCSASGAAGAFDFVSGVQDWSQAILLASNGPGKSTPDAAVLAPNASGFTPDDGNSGVISLFGGKFSVLPGEPSPSGACPGRRSITLAVQADGGKVSLVASGHLGLSSVYGSGHGASGATSALTVIASVTGVGTASASLDPSAIADVEH